ncbi:MAG: RHS domain-containing protein [Polyangiaceae bacterium]|nr:RHS domain-containing protein [Polyangiaceae bacterium]
MASTVKGKNVATTGSGHVAPGPPATSMIPPPPPTGPVASPFLYVAKSATGKNVCQQIKCGGDPVLKKGSTMDIELPANLPANALPIKDIVTHAVQKVAKTLNGSKSAKASDVEICVTGDDVVLNLLSKQLEVHQSKGKFISGLSFVKAMNSKSEKHAAKVYVAAEPVAVASGDVVDTFVDYTLYGIVPITFRRHYNSSRSTERTPLGRGGFTHSYHQYLTIQESKVVLREEDGREVTCSLPAPSKSEVHRGSRLEFFRRNDGQSFDVKNLTTGIVRHFAPETRGGSTVLQSISDAWGNRVELKYENGLLSAITDPFGRKLSFSSDAQGRIVRVDVSALDYKITPPKTETLASWSYNYSPEGDLESAVDSLGVTEAYRYDAKHRLVEKKAKNGIAFKYEYDEKTGRCLRAWGDGGLHGFEFTYDLQKGTTTAHGNPEPRVFHWNEDGAVLKERTYDSSYLDENVYDADLLVIEQKDAAGSSRVYEYNARGHLVKATDPEGNVATWEYDGDNMVKWTDAGGGVATFSYNERGAVTAFVTPGGIARSLTYDGRGLLTGIFGPSGVLVRIEHDDLGNIARVTKADGQVTRYEADLLGRLTKKTDPAGDVTAYTWDAAGHLTSVTFPPGDTVTVTYDALGCPKELTDWNGRVTRFKYEGTGQLARLEDPAGNVWEYVRDVNERLRFVRDPKGNTHEIRYDRAGRVREELTFDGRLVRYDFSKNGRVSRVEFPDGMWRSYEFDGTGNVLVEDSPHGTRTFQRNTRGEIEAALLDEQWGKVLVEFERDALGRIVGVSQNGRVVRYEYDAAGRLTTLTLPDGRRTLYFYDLMDRVVGIDYCGHKTLLVRDGSGREIRRYIYEANVDILTAHGPHGFAAERSVMLHTQKGPQTLSRRGWKFQAGGLLVASEDLHWGKKRYEHDTLGRLTSVHTARTSDVLEYDVSGALHRMASLDEQSAPWSLKRGGMVARTPHAELSYDEQSRRKRKTILRDHKPTGEAFEYLWDAFGQLREVKLPTGGRVLFVYDAFGRRVKKQVIGPAPADSVSPMGTLGTPPEVQTTEFLWDADHILGEIESSGHVRVHTRIPLSGVPVMQDDNGHATWVVTDHLGTPKDLITGKGELAWTADHTVWGKLVAEKGGGVGSSVKSPLRLFGQYHDSETGLSATRYRYFDADQAKWISPDPIGLRGGMDLFGFGGNPTNTVDPLGLKPCPGLGYVKFTVDKNGHINGMTAIITKDMCNSGLGTDANGGIIPPGWISPGYDRAHLWANRMGGSGDWEQNLVTMRADYNQHTMRMIEDRAFNTVTPSTPITYDVNITNYGNGRPSSVDITYGPVGGTTVTETVL